MRGLLFIFLAVIVGACSEVVTQLDGDTAAGSWEYSGTQEIPQSAVLSGSLSLYAVSSSPAAFEGGASLSEVAPNGQLRELHGIAGGSIYSDSIVDFDIVVLGIARRHVGILRGDSIAGSWLSADGGAAGGKFNMRRSQQVQ